MKRYLVVFASAGALLAFSVPAAQAGTGGEPPPAGVVSPTPPANVPHLPVTTSQVEQIRQLVQCGSTMYAVGTFHHDQAQQHDLHPQQHLQLQRHRALRGDELGTEHRRHLRDHVQREQHAEHDRVRGRQLRGRLHRRPLLLGQRHRRQEHRRDQHDHWQRGHRLQVERVRRSGDHRRPRAVTCWSAAASPASTATPPTRTWPA